jgi:hypothetical protein
MDPIRSVGEPAEGSLTRSNRIYPPNCEFCYWPALVLFPLYRGTETGSGHECLRCKLRSRMKVSEKLRHCLCAVSESPHTGRAFCSDDRAHTLCAVSRPRVAWLQAPSYASRRFIIDYGSYIHTTLPERPQWCCSRIVLFD